MDDSFSSSGSIRYSSGRVDRGLIGLDNRSILSVSITRGEMLSRVSPPTVFSIQCKAVWGKARRVPISAKEPTCNSGPRDCARIHPQFASWFAKEVVLWVAG